MNVFLLGIYIIIIMIRPMEWWEPVQGWQLINIGAIATWLVGVPVFLNRSRAIWQQIPQLKLAILFWFTLMLSFALHGYLGGILLVFQELGKVIFFFVLLVVLVEDLKGFNTLLWALQVGILFLAVHAILQHNTGVGFGGKLPSPRPNELTGEITYQARAFGTFDDPNDLCLLLVVGVPLFFVLYKIGANPLQKAFAISGCILSGYGAWCTNSRGGVVAAFGMIGAFVLVQMRGIKRYLTAGFAFSVVTVLAPSRFGGGGGFIGKDRSELWGDGLNMFKSNPIFGVGYHEFVDNTARHQVAHNSFVHTLAEGGIAGYLPFFLLLYLTMVQLRRLINEKKIMSKQDYHILSGVFAALAGDFTGMYFISRQYQHIFYTLLAVSITLTYLVSKKYDLQSLIFGQARKDIRMGMLFGLGSIVVMWITIRLANVFGGGG